VITLTIAIQKGGTGKTTTAVTLGAAFAALGRRVLLLDLDPQGHVAVYLQRPPGPQAAVLLLDHLDPPRNVVVDSGRPGLGIVPADHTLTTAANVLAGDLFGVFRVREALERFEQTDVCIIDTAPSNGILQQAAIMAADFVIAPCATQYAAVRGVLDLVGTLNALSRRGSRARLMFAVPTRYRPRLNEHRASIADLQREFAGHVTPAVAERTVVEKCGAAGVTVWELAREPVDELMQRARIAAHRRERTVPHGVLPSAWEYARVAALVQERIS